MNLNMGLNFILIRLSAMPEEAEKVHSFDSFEYERYEVYVLIESGTKMYLVEALAPD